MFHGRGRRWDGGFGGFFLGRRGSGSGSVLSFPVKNNRKFVILVVNKGMHFEWIQRDAGLFRLCSVNTRPTKWIHMKRIERFDVHTMEQLSLFGVLSVSMSSMSFWRLLSIRAPPFKAPFRGTGKRKILNIIAHLETHYIALRQ